jgi:hypothetical protein
MDNYKNFQLKGTNKQKAEQLINQIKERHLSKEVLDAILPFEKDFYKSLVEMFRVQLDKESQDNKVYVETIDNIICNLSSIIPNDKLDSETRMQIINLIYKMTDDLKDNQNNKTKEAEKTKRTMIVSTIVAAALGIAIWLGFGYNNGNGGNTIKIKKS